ncbi:hypothetical protein Hanom_Chr10g00902401 [Helianthus anomalus]
MTTYKSYERHCCIICFDAETETFRKICFPHVPDGTINFSGSLVILNGCLHLFVS